ncbi:MAG: energy-coupling factor transporter transmembrane component T family protein [Zhaonellaceae bacterium]|jgi:energy-coupling factor transporter transmembrane protein EcfT|nr:energy-coupling factor transporter transmembrane protein EcfT [Clostridia bacterium]
MSEAALGRDRGLRKTIFGYTPKWTPFSVFHPFARMMLIILFNAPFFIVNPLVNSIFFVLALSCFAIARIPGSYLKKFIGFVIVMTLTLFLSFAFFPSVWIKPPYQHVIFKLGFFTYHYENFIVSVTMWFRWMSAIFGVLFVFSVIDEKDINIALKILRFPYFLRLAVATALRCFFTFYYDALQIIEAQKARGLDLDSMSTFKKLKYYVAVMVPLVMTELKKADEMADAADSRGYVATFKTGDYKRTEYVGHELSFGPQDFILMFLCVAVLITAIVSGSIPGLGPIVKFIPADPSFWATLF